MAAASSLARSMIAMADSRLEVLHREVGLSDMMDYVVELCSADSIGLLFKVRPNKLFAITDKGYELKVLEELRFERKGASLRACINKLSLLGFQVWDKRQSSDKCMMFVLKVPRAIAMQNIHAM